MHLFCEIHTSPYLKVFEQAQCISFWIAVVLACTMLL